LARVTDEDVVARYPKHFHRAREILEIKSQIRDLRVRLDGELDFDEIQKIHREIRALQEKLG